MKHIHFGHKIYNNFTCLARLCALLPVIHFTDYSVSIKTNSTGSKLILCKISKSAVSVCISHRNTYTINQNYSPNYLKSCKWGDIRVTTEAPRAPWTGHECDLTGYSCREVSEIRSKTKLRSISYLATPEIINIQPQMSINKKKVNKHETGRSTVGGLYGGFTVWSKCHCIL